MLNQLALGPDARSIDDDAIAVPYRDALAAAWARFDDDRRLLRTRTDGATPGRPRVVSDALAQLTDGQRDCLRLVYRHMTSKDIARALAISPHTVDMRLRTAMRTLAVASRIDAARLLIEHEGGAVDYQPLIYQAPELAGAAAEAPVAVPAPTANDDHALQHTATRFGPEPDAPVNGPPRSSGASAPYPGVAGYGERTDGERHPTPLVNSLPWGARNRLSPGARIVWIVMIAIGSALGFGAILAALEALKSLL